jgi:predicted permease
MGGLLADLRFALRFARKSPGFSVAAVLSLALGIGANLTIFTFVNGIMLRPMPAARAEELVSVYGSSASAPYSPLSYPDYQRFRADGIGVAELTAYQIVNVAIGSGRDSELRAGMFVDDNYFAVLGVRPAAGRLAPTPGSRSGDALEVIISSSLAVHRFGGARPAVGRGIEVNGRIMTVAGVAPASFQPVLGLSMDVIAPLGVRAVLDPAMGRLENENSIALSALGRLRPGATVPSAERALNQIARAIDAAEPRVHRGIVQARAIRLANAGVLPPAARTPLKIVAMLLFLVTGLVLVLACTNLANLLLARASARRRELAVRAALGASRARIVRQLLLEGVLLSAAAAVAGVLFARAAVVALLTLLPSSPVPLLVDVSLDSRIVVGATFLAVLAPLLFSLSPALEATKYSLVDALKEATPGSGVTISQVRQRRRLVGAQVMVTTMLLVVAGLFVRSLMQAQSIDTGFATGHVLLGTINAGQRFPRPEDGAEFYRRLIRQLQSLPGVHRATVVQRVPLDFGNQAMVFEAENGRRGGADYNIVGAGYFATMGIPLRAGRDFSPAGTRNGEVIINETLARSYFGDGTALGRRMSVGGGSPKWLEVVGVVKDGKYRSLSEPPRPFFYLPFEETYRAEMTLAVSTEGDPRPLVPIVRDEIIRIDGSVPLYQVRSLKEHVHGALFPARMAGLLLGALGLLTFVLAGLGIYGVMAFSTQLRQGEMGIRLALGADRTTVLNLMVRQGMAPVAVGLAAGLALAFLVSRGLAKFLYGVHAADPITYGLVSATIGAMALACCFVPAWRVSHTHPSNALRQI